MSRIARTPPKLKKGTGTGLRSATGFSAVHDPNARPLGGYNDRREPCHYLEGQIVSFPSYPWFTDFEQSSRGDAHCSSFVHFDARHTPSSPHAGRTNFDLLTGFAPACYTLQSTCHQLFVQVLEGEFRTRPVIASVIDSAKLVRHGGLRLLQMNRGRLMRCVSIAQSASEKQLTQGHQLLRIPKFSHPY